VDDERDRMTPAWVDVDELKEGEDIRILASVNRPSNEQGRMVHGIRSLSTQHEVSFGVPRMNKEEWSN
jgi:hypothetical protein